MPTHPTKAATFRGPIDSLSLDRPGLDRLGLIAGGGGFPLAVVRACNQAEIPVSIAAISGFAASKDLREAAPLREFRIGEFGSIGRYFHQQGVSHVMAIGFVPRVGLTDIHPNFATLRLYIHLACAQRALGGFGDDRLLRLIGRYVETEWKFPVLGATELFPELLVPNGRLGRCQPNRQQRADIETGFRILAGLSDYDVGQAVIVQHGRIMALEAAEGTAELINRTAKLLKRGSKAVLVKAPKRRQDLRLDVPTIGVDTIEQARAANLGGIAVEAHGVQTCNLDEVVLAANTSKLFLEGWPRI